MGSGNSNLHNLSDEEKAVIAAGLKVVLMMLSPRIRALLTPPIPMSAVAEKV
jgi:hypothetical protein